MSADPEAAAIPVRLLVIEDEPDEAELVIALLDSTGAVFEATICGRLSEAIERCSQERYDAVLLDLGLPDTAGLETFRRLHRSVPEIPIVVISAAAEEQMARAAIRDGAHDYLPKSSLTGDALLRSLRFVIGRAGSDSADGRARAEHLRRQQQALLRRLAASGTGGVAGRVLGTRLLRELSPELFTSLQHRLAQIIDLQTDEYVFGIEHDTTSRLRDLAADLGDAMSGPRDVVELYRAVMASKEGDKHMPQDRLGQYEEICRAAAFELMGYLVSAYRARVVPNHEGS